MKPTTNGQPTDASTMGDEYGYFSDLDEETIGELDKIESQHNSPAKDFSSLSQVSPLGLYNRMNIDSSDSPTNFKAASSSSLIWPAQYPSTPSIDRTISPNTPDSRLSVARASFSLLGIQSPGPLPTPKRLFPEAGTNIPTAKAKEKQRQVLVIEDDSDEDSQEVSALLNDTDTESGSGSLSNNISRDTSLSSLGSGWSMPSFSSFSSAGLPPSPSKKRLSNTQPTPGTGTGTPSKYRRVERNGVPSHPHDDDDIFYSPPSSLGTTSSEDSRSRHKQWNTDIGAPAPPPVLPVPPLPSPAPAPSLYNIDIDPNSPLARFLAGPLGVDLTPCIVAHNEQVQKSMDNYGIAWGVQYELARGVSKGWWTWMEVQGKINNLKGTNKEVGPKVQAIMLNRRPKTLTSDIWEELDREQDAILEGKGRGLGLMGTWRNVNDWYGGQIQQILRLAVGDDDGYKVVLEPLEKRKSNLLARYLASRRVMVLKVPKELQKEDGEGIRRWIVRRKYIVNGRVYVPLFAKDRSVFLVETNENFGARRARAECGDHQRMAFGDIVKWHNALDVNRNQPVSKWSTRFALLLSNSVPAILFEEEDIHAIDDLYAPYDGEGKHPADFIYTDGCGYINEAALRSLALFLKLGARPTAIQGRIAGSKGLWILHPTDKSLEPRIWIRTSQQKITYHRPLQRSHCIFDLVSISRPSLPVSLSKQSIMNLSENGVPDNVLEEMIVNGLMEEVEPLMRWEGPQAMVMLGACVDRIGGVSKGRQQKQLAGMARVLGLQKREWREGDIDEEDDGDLAPVEDPDDGGYTGRNPYSGAPHGLYEVTIELLQAGFCPKDLGLLKNKIRWIMKSTITKMIEKYRIPLSESLNAFIIPDPFGVLEDGEIYYRSSQALTDSETQATFNVVVGPVLVGRYPIRLPSDIQKVLAVDRPQLYNYPDVLVVSTKGDRSFASLLSGGDYDGDEVFILREKAIVEPFQGKALSPPPDKFMEDNFHKSVERVEAFAERAMEMSPRDAQMAFQEIMLLSLSDVKFGMYSRFQDYAIWKHGYDDHRSIRLAYMFNTLLDSSKTGVQLLLDVWQQDQRLYNHDVPDQPERYEREKSYIFHALHRAGQAAGDALLRRYDILSNTCSERKDKQLLSPYEVAKALSKDVVNPYHQALADELNAIETAVKKSHAEWSAQIGKISKAKQDESMSPLKKQKKSYQRKPDPKAHASQLYDEDIPGINLFQNIRALKASFAYDTGRSFAFDVAFRDLCIIKASASPEGIAPCIRSFDEARSIPSSFTRAMHARLTMDVN